MDERAECGPIINSLARKDTLESKKAFGRYRQLYLPIQIHYVRKESWRLHNNLSIDDLTAVGTYTSRRSAVSFSYRIY